MNHQQSKGVHIQTEYYNTKSDNAGIIHVLKVVNKQQGIKTQKQEHDELPSLRA